MFVNVGELFTVMEICEATGRTEGDIRSRINTREKAGVLKPQRGHKGRPAQYTYDEVKAILFPRRGMTAPEEREDNEPDPGRVQALRHQLVTDGIPVR